MLRCEAAAPSTGGSGDLVSCLFRVGSRLAILWDDDRCTEERREATADFRKLVGSTALCVDPWGLDWERGTGGQKGREGFEEETVQLRQDPSRQGNVHHTGMFSGITFNWCCENLTDAASDAAHRVRSSTPTPPILPGKGQDVAC